MVLSKINDRFYRKFLMNHLDNKFDIEDLYDVVSTLNPANNNYKIKSEAERFSDSSHTVDMKIAYSFRTQKAADLFVSSYENLVQKGKSILKIKQKDNKVLLTLKEPVLVNHKTKNIGTALQQSKIKEAVGFREESDLISDIFMTIDQILTSGIYQLGDNTANRLQKRQISNNMALEAQEKRINKNKNESLYSLYKRTMLSNSIQLNPEINNEILKQVSQAMDDRVNRVNGKLLLSRMFRNYKSNSLSTVLNMENPRIKNILNSVDMIDQKAISSQGFLRKQMQKLSSLFTEDKIIPKKEERKVIKLKYK